MVLGLSIACGLLAAMLTVMICEATKQRRKAEARGKTIKAERKKREDLEYETWAKRVAGLPRYSHSENERCPVCGGRDTFKKAWDERWKSYTSGTCAKQWRDTRYIELTCVACQATIQRRPMKDMQYREAYA